jgi:DNA-binding IclR family transcriptional regulator
VVRVQRRGNESRAKVYEAVSSRWRTGHYAPTIREIAEEVSLSVASVHRHVRILTEQGILKGRGRTLRPDWAADGVDPHPTGS